MRSLALLVPKAEGERVRRRLRREGLLREDLRIAPEGDVLCLPVTEEVAWGYRLEEREFQKKEVRPASYRDLVTLPEELGGLLPRAYDVVGDVVILKLPEALEAHGEAIGEALLRVHRHARTVAVDEGVAGRRRSQRLRVVAGRRSTRTVHREYGLLLAVDPAEVHFSPRMATERRRVAGQVRRGEVVVDAFCGVGPFALHVARAGAEAVHAVDDNPRAMAFLEENLRRNRVENVTPHRGDVTEVLPQLATADRLILDFPQDPLPLVPLAAETLRDGGVLHYYEILERAALDARVEALRAAVPERRGLEVLHVREVRGYAPTQGHYALDLRIGGG